MQTLLESFQMGGPGMIPTAVAGLILILVSGLYAIRPERRYVPLLVSLSALTLVAGGLGFVTGVIKSISAMGRFDADIKLSVLGTGESLNNVALALGFVLLAMIATSLGALRLARRPA